jgi:hypothetical protein
MIKVVEALQKKIKNKKIKNTLNKTDDQYG